MIASLNRRWDQQRAEARLAELGIPLDRRVRRMSGGQQAQLALTLALARRPKLLVLDEPLAMLDPLARFDFMDTVITAASQDGLSVVLSSHVLAELERVAGHLILLSHGRLQVARNVQNLLDGHQVRSGPAGQAAKLAGQLPVVHAATDDDQARLLVGSGDRVSELPEGWHEQPASLEEMVLGYLREPSVRALPEAEEAPASGEGASPCGSRWPTPLGQLVKTGSQRPAADPAGSRPVTAPRPRQCQGACPCLTRWPPGPA